MYAVPVRRAKNSLHVKHLRSQCNRSQSFVCNPFLYPLNNALWRAALKEKVNIIICTLEVNKRLQPVSFKEKRNSKRTTTTTKRFVLQLISSYHSH